jgi:segregation and condensation protein B
MNTEEAASNMDPDFIRRVVEAALLASPQPLALAQLAALFHDEERPAPGALEQAIQALREESAARGVELVEVASGFRFQVKADVHAFVARLWTERQVKYTRATLETLALIAYRQPITRGEIESIRGVGVNANTIKMLEEREWIRVIGHRDVPGRPELFGTTRAFLDYFGLKNLEDLPALAELNEIPELEPQLPFGGDPPPVAAAAFDPDLLDPDTDDDTNEEAGSEAEPELKDE